PKFMDTPGQVWRGQVDIGFDTERILGELLGYSDIEIESLKGRGIID
ncbi:MAG: CoA transferase, partial [Syntrophomonadaceae bacterium]|nr:CoA transferase [Syntrophomonadaceae bacterium]